MSQKVWTWYILQHVSLKRYHTSIAWYIHTCMYLIHTTCRDSSLAACSSAVAGCQRPLPGQPFQKLENDVLSAKGNIHMWNWLLWVVHLNNETLAQSLCQCDLLAAIHIWNPMICTARPVMIPDAHHGKSMYIHTCNYMVQNLMSSAIQLQLYSIHIQYMIPGQTNQTDIIPYS